MSLEYKFSPNSIFLAVYSQLKSLLQTSVEEFVSQFDPKECDILPVFRMALTFDNETMELYPTLEDLHADVLDIVKVIASTLQVRLCVYQRFKGK